MKWTRRRTKSKEGGEVKRMKGMRRRTRSKGGGRERV